MLMNRERQVGEVNHHLSIIFTFAFAFASVMLCIHYRYIFLYVFRIFSLFWFIFGTSGVFSYSVICCQTISFWDHEVHLLWSICSETRPTAYPLSWVLHARPCWRSQSCVPGPCWWAPQWSTLCVWGTQAPAPVFLRSRALCRHCRTALAVDVWERIPGECQRYMQSATESALLTLCLHTHYYEEFNWRWSRQDLEGIPPTCKSKPKPPAK